MLNKQWKFICTACDSHFDTPNLDAEHWNICPHCGSGRIDVPIYCEACGVELFEHGSDDERPYVISGGKFCLSCKEEGDKENEIA